MIAFSFSPTRDDTGRVDFSQWFISNDFEKLASTKFEEAIEEAFADFPPVLSLGVSDRDDGDVVVTISFAGSLGNDRNIGPSWTFFIKDAIESVYIADDESVEALAKALRSLADYAESIGGRGKS